MSAYMDKHDIDDDAIGKKAPFEKPLIGFKHFVEHGNDEGLDIAITQVIVIFVVCPPVCCQMWPPPFVCAVRADEDEWDANGHLTWLDVDVADGRSCSERFWLPLLVVLAQLLALLKNPCIF